MSVSDCACQTGCGWAYVPCVGFAACADCNDDMEKPLTPEAMRIAQEDFVENTELYCSLVPMSVMFPVSVN